MNMYIPFIVLEPFEESEPRIHFITYANDAFHAAGGRLLQEAKEMDIFTGTIRMYTPNDLDDKFKAAVGGVLQRHRGGGYWVWKPYIVNDALEAVSANDIVVYADAGCKLNKSAAQRLRDYIAMVHPSSGKSVFAMYLFGHPENAWTISEVFEYFGMNPSSDIGTSYQIVTGLHIYRKCSESSAMVRRWLDTAVARPDLFTDDYNSANLSRNPGFKEARHDQSVFSLILKIEPYKNTAVIIEEEIEPTESRDSSKQPVLAKRLRV